jgi:hypothetical protein
MVKTRRSTDSHGIFSSEMPVRASTSADNIDFDVSYSLNYSLIAWNFNVF